MRHERVKVAFQYCLSENRFDVPWPDPEIIENATKEHADALDKGWHSDDWEKTNPIGSLILGWSVTNSGAIVEAKIIFAGLFSGILDMPVGTIEEDTSEAFYE